MQIWQISFAYTDFISYICSVLGSPCTLPLFWEVNPLVGDDTGAATLRVKI